MMTSKNCQKWKKLLISLYQVRMNRPRQYQWMSKDSDNMVKMVDKLLKWWLVIIYISSFRENTLGNITLLSPSRPFFYIKPPSNQQSPTHPLSTHTSKTSTPTHHSTYTRSTALSEDYTNHYIEIHVCHFSPYSRGLWSSTVMAPTRAGRAADQESPDTSDPATKPSPEAMVRLFSASTNIELHTRFTIFSIVLTTNGAGGRWDTRLHRRFRY